MAQIPVRLEDRDATLSVTEDSRFILDTTSYSTLKDNHGWRQEKYDSAHREGISFDELLRWLQNISDAIGESIEIESETHKSSSRHKSSIDGELYVTSYKIKVHDNVVFNKNTLKDGSLYEIRKEIVDYIARLIFDYEMFEYNCAKKIAK